VEWEWGTNLLYKEHKNVPVWDVFSSRGIIREMWYSWVNRMGKMLRPFCLFVLAILFFGVLGARPSIVFAQALTNFWTTNGGSVSEIIQSNDTVYVGGAFTSFTPFAGGYIPLNNSTAELESTFPIVYGTVNAVVPDGLGGSYIAGSFTKIGNFTRIRLAHILPDRTVDPNFDPAPNGTVNSLSLSGSTLYLGGSFTSVGGQSRNRLAALDATTGVPTSWNPNVSGVVSTMVVATSTLYVGGSFTSIGGTTRNKIGEIDLASASATLWNPNVTGTGAVVSTMQLSGGKLYTGGVFSSIGGVTRNSIAAIDINSASATAWNPNATPTNNNDVNSLVVSGSNVYIGGNFTAIGGVTRNRIAAIDITSASATAWNPNSSSNIFFLSLNGSTLYVGGQFATIGGATRSTLAALDISTGLATSWNPDINGTGNNRVNGMMFFGTTIYIGGGFTGAGHTTRNRLAAFSKATGEITSWDPNVGNNVVNSLVMNGSNIYIGGSFTSVGGVNRSFLGAVDATTGLLTDWQPFSNVAVTQLGYNNGIVYYSGSGITTVGVAHRGAAPLDKVSGLVESGALTLNGNVNAVVSDGAGGWYIGGTFTTVGTVTRNRLAHLLADNSLDTSWDPNVGGTVNALFLSGSVLYVGGIFTTVGASTRNNIAAISTATGLPTLWDPNIPNTVSAIAVSGTNIYVGGSFTSVGGDTRNRIAAIDAVSASATAWNPNAGGTVSAIAVSGTNIYVGGAFTTIGGVTRNRIAAIDATNASATAWNPNAGSTVNALAVNGSNVYAGGVFTTIGGATRNDIAAIDVVSGSSTSWDPNANNSVLALAVDGTTVFAGGSFTTMNAQSRTGFAAADAITGMPTSWNPGAFVSTMEFSGSNMFVGGTFTTIGGASRNRIAALDLTTASATAWNPNASAQVNDLAISSSNVYAGGTFTTIGGVTRNRIAVIDMLTASATAWNPNMGGTVSALAVTDSLVYTAGTFTTVGGVTRQGGMAAIDIATGLPTSWTVDMGSFLFSSQKVLVGGSNVYLVSSNNGLDFYFGIFPTSMVTVIQSGSSTDVTEGGATDSYTLALSTQPSSTVMITITPSADVTVSPSTVTFTTSTWNIPQTVTVSAVDDSTAQGAHTGTISHTVTSDDIAYNNAQVSLITVHITDNDSTFSNGNGGGGSGHPGSVYIPYPDSSGQSTSPILTPSTIPAQTLLKLPDDGNPETQSDSAVYYIGTDGMRHAFPNEKVYFTWYISFGGIQLVSAEQLASIPLGKNVTYKPGVRMVKFTTVPDVYVVEKNGLLRHVVSEDVAAELYGAQWNRVIDDISDAFYSNYTFGAPVNSTADYNPAAAQASVRYPSDSLGE
jgi:hypothetical protein